MQESTSAEIRIAKKEHMNKEQTKATPPSRSVKKIKLVDFQEFGLLPELKGCSGSLSIGICFRFQSM